MFLGTVGISERQVRTSLEKAGRGEDEGRGGRQKSFKMRDQTIKKQVEAHINRFPRTESHYCRKKSTGEFLAPELTIQKMHDLYMEAHDDQPVSLSFYGSVFRKMGLKFHTPKKDQCGLCSTYINGNQEEKEKLQECFDRHIQEKTLVREKNEEMKTRALADDRCVSVNFDLQQVLYLPVSKRSELFYKRRLASYNFTIYNLGRGAGHCYFWPESLGARGTNEIASHVHHFLQSVDGEGANEVAMFCDGCAGQNKNSILPALLLRFLQSSTAVKQVAIYFFETSHGQCEGDSMHSTIERAVRRAGYVFVPTQMATIICMARREPYVVHEVQTASILDWKTLSQQRQILRIRTSQEGHDKVWTKVMVIMVSKDSPNTIGYTISHSQKECFHLKIPTCRRSSANLPDAAYSGPLKVSESKYRDLISLCTGQTPVISNASHAAFFQSLPH